MKPNKTARSFQVRLAHQILLVGFLIANTQYVLGESTAAPSALLKGESEKTVENKIPDKNANLVVKYKGILRQAILASPMPFGLPSMGR